jgi:hypothetical protein
MYLPNSHLVFIYMPGGAKTQMEVTTLFAGTKPDVYMNFGKAIFIYIMK